MAKQGMNLTAMAAELQRRSDGTVKDYIAEQGAVEMTVGSEGTVLLDGINGGLAVRPYAHKQIGDHLGIPARYYDRMLVEKPTLLAKNVNDWLHSAPKEKRQIRTIDGQARAFLSPSYRALDNFDLAEAVIPVLLNKGCQIISSALTETRMYLKAILPSMCKNVPVGVTLGQGHNFHKGMIIAAINISNSEVGAGRLMVEEGTYNTNCTNLAQMGDARIRKTHLGRDQGLDIEGSIEELLRDKTRKLRDAAFWNTVRDVVEDAFNAERFEARMVTIETAAGRVIESENLPKVVEVTTARLKLPGTINNGVLASLAKGGDLTQWGLSNAYTAVANHVEDYELATDLERAGGAVLEIPKTDWAAIAEVA